MRWRARFPTQGKECTTSESGVWPFALFRELDIMRLSERVGSGPKMNIDALHHRASRRFQRVAGVCAGVPARGPISAAEIDNCSHRRLVLSVEQVLRILLCAVANVGE